MKSRFILFIFFLLFSSFAFAGEAKPLYGTLYKAVDGDSFFVKLESGNIEEVRLIGADTPEIRHRFWSASKKFTVKFLTGHRLKILPRGRDRYKRLLAFVLVKGKSLNYELIKAGLAKLYRGHNSITVKSTFDKYWLAEHSAYTARIGIHSPATKMR